MCESKYVGNPILGICKLDSGLAEIIIENNCGIISEGHDLEYLAEQIRELQHNKPLLEELKLNSLAASKSFTKANALKYV